MLRVVLDTCILIDHLNGIDAARTELALHPAAAISVVTWMEVMAGAPPAGEAATRAFLDGFIQIPLDAAVAEAAVRAELAAGAAVYG